MYNILQFVYHFQSNVFKTFDDGVGKAKEFFPNPKVDQLLYADII